jgi:lipoprotein-anchoring transpeptidase ErfK/SrfK
MKDGSAAHWRRGHAAALAAVSVVVALLALALWPSTGNPRSAAGGFLRGPAQSALEVPKPEILGGDSHKSLWSVVRRPATARATPGRAGVAVTRLAPRTPEGTANTLLILDRTHDATGRVWVRARLPVLPNGTTGWLPRSAIGGYRSVNTRLVIDRRRFRAILLRDGRPVMRARIGIGLSHWPTPGGRFYVRNKLVRYRSSFYGPVAFGTSARSAVLTDWPGGGFIGIHGTNQPGLLPGRVSHGCIRMRNADIVRLGRLMPVGTPMEVV